MRGGAPRQPEREVMDAAALLDISEYDLLWLAYRRWYGRDPSTAFLDRVFAAYMFNAVVPPWARFHAREILARDRPDPSERRGVGPATRGPGDLVKALLVLLLLGTITALLVVLAEVALWPAARSCYFPPCY